MKQCQVTGKKTSIGGRYSNRTRATKFNPTGKVKRRVNMHRRSIFVPEIDKKVRIVISAKGLRECRKNGIHKTLKKQKIV